MTTESPKPAKNIFISWSKSKSFDIAHALYRWLPNVVQAADPWISAEDIEPGMRWQMVLAENLQRFDVGILCVTRENLESQWLLFEAGALSQSIDSSCVIPYLIDLQPAELPPPLDQFNAVSADEAGTKRLASRINSILGRNGRPVDDERLASTFSRYWPDLRRDFRDLSIHLPGSDSSVHRVEATSSESAAVSDLVRSIDFERLSHIDVCAHTGQSLIEGLLSSIGRASDRYPPDTLKRVRIRVLIRSPRHETADRASSILQTLKRLNRFRRTFPIEYHFYSHLPLFRFVACHSRQDVDEQGAAPSEAAAQRTEREAIDALFGWYFYPSPRTESRRYPRAIMLRGVSPEAPDEEPDEESQDTSALHTFQVANAWFNNMWGVSTEQYKVTHTIVFDFDDTIVNSHEEQVRAWVDTVFAFVGKRGTEILTPELRKCFRPAKEAAQRKRVTAVVRRCFFQEQSAHLIVGKLFERREGEIEPFRRLRDEIEEHRRTLRAAYTLQATLFPDAAEVIERLSRQYNLAVISATDEVTIHKYFEKAGMAGRFKYVFGRWEHGKEWKSIERKSELLVKMVDVLGVPAERLIFVGDNNGDYRAATTVHVDFIEARLMRDDLAQWARLTSLLHDDQRDDQDRYLFEAWSDLEGQIQKMEDRKRSEFESQTSVTLG